MFYDGPSLIADKNDPHGFTHRNKNPKSSGELTTRPIVFIPLPRGAAAVASSPDTPLGDEAPSIVSGLPPPVRAASLEDIGKSPAENGVGAAGVAGARKHAAAIAAPAVEQVFVRNS